MDREQNNLQELYDQWQQSAASIAKDELSAMDEAWRRAVEYRLGNFGEKILSHNDIASIVNVFYGNVESSLQKASTAEMVVPDKLEQETRKLVKTDPLLADAIQTTGQFLIKVQRELPEIPPVFTRTFIPARRSVITEQVSQVPIFSTPLLRRSA